MYIKTELGQRDKLLVILNYKKNQQSTYTYDALNIEKYLNKLPLRFQPKAKSIIINSKRQIHNYCIKSWSECKHF